MWEERAQGWGGHYTRVGVASLSSMKEARPLPESEGGTVVWERRCSGVLFLLYTFPNRMHSLVDGLYSPQYLEGLGAQLVHSERCWC